MERAEPRGATRAVRAMGAAIGAATGPVAAFGQSWAGTGDGRAHVWILATVVGALLGALTWPLFQAPAPRETTPDRAPDGNARTPPSPGAGFGALFGFSVGLVAGAFAAFPMGSVLGAFGGIVAGALTVFAGDKLQPVRGGLAIASVIGAGTALLIAWAWLS